MEKSFSKISDVILNKPPVFVFSSLIYVLVAGLLKWQVHPTIDAFWFVFGGILGVYLLDLAELIIHQKPSPFRTIVFLSFFTIVSFFIVSSSVSIFGRGLVLTMHLTFLLLQIGEWRNSGNLNSWYDVLADSVSVKTQLLLLWLFGAILGVETFLFAR